MDEVIKVKDQFYILARSSLADIQPRVLKHSDTFGIFDRHGNIRPLGFEDHGIFYEGTRFLSRLDIRINGQSPLLLSSNVKEDNDFLVADLTNPDLEDENGRAIQRGTVHLVRIIFLWDARYFEKIRISNFGQEPVSLTLSFNAGADYVDIFEVRGMKRLKSGTMLATRTRKNGLVFGYQGLDQKKRTTDLRFQPAPEGVRSDGADFKIKLKPHEEKSIELTCACQTGEKRRSRITLKKAFQINRKIYQDYRTHTCLIETSNERFNDWLQQSRADLHMLLTHTEHGLYPYAGIPWFSTVFGRDGIITAFQTLWFYPEIAKGVLSYLAKTQAIKNIPRQDAEPGKILHETRKGEMAALDEIPFGQYYGTIDATPLFVLLAGHYHDRTADTAFIKKIWPNIQAALDWIDHYGDPDQTGFVAYQRHAERGLFNQGWKDSEDSIFYADGNIAEPPIALCEVQGYVYAAKQKASEMAAALNDKRKAVLLRQSANEFKARFQKHFWSERLGMYALALDGRKKPCLVRSSNAGQCLMTGIASPEHAAKMAKRLFEADFFSGWGIRTIPVSESRYNPMSYHNGSIWPHDNSLIAYGLAQYGYKEEAMKIMEGMFDSSIFLDLHRLPELFCGFNRRTGEGPTLYPVACDPQAWAAGSVFLLLQSCLGLSIRANEQKVHFDNPALPPFLREVNIYNLKIKDAVLDLTLRCHDRDVVVNVKRKVGDIGVIATK